MTTTTLTRDADVAKQAGLTSRIGPLTIERVTPLAGRGLVSAIFLMSAVGKLGNFAGTASMMATKGFPAASAFLLGAIVVEICGGLSVLTGYKARWGAAALFAFLIPTTLIFHNFWAYTGADLEAQMIHFLKNVSIMGGLLSTVAFGSGALSLDSRRTR
jgi:putative oxidoreductase